MDVFISYPRKLRGKVEPIKRSLEGLGITTFFDVQGIDGGQQFPDAIDRGLKSSDVVLGCWSPAAFESKWCMIECRYAIEHDILVPVMIERFERRVQPADLMFANYFDLTDWKGEGNHEGWQRTLQSLTRRIRRNIPIRPSTAPRRTAYPTRSTTAASPQHGPLKSSFLLSLVRQSNAPLRRTDFEQVAARLGCEWQAVAAVAEVESGPLGGFAVDGRPHILFERHLFSRKTTSRFDASHPAISNRTPGGYPRTQAERWQQLDHAYALDPDAALQSTSYGRFQVLGQNSSNLGMNTHEYVAKLARSERDQLDAFEGFLRANGLGKALQRRDWADFARRYNGPGYAQHQYDTKMEQTYQRLKTNPIS